MSFSANCNYLISFLTKDSYISTRRMMQRSRTIILSLAALLGGSVLVDAAPKIQSLSCSPGIGDARNADVIVTCALRVVDADSEIDFAYTRLVSPSGKFSLPLLFDGGKSFGLTSYTGANLAASATIPRHAEAGYWQLDFSGVDGLQVVNKQGASVMITSKEARDLGLSRFVKIYSPDDKTPPYIKDVVCTTPVDVNITTTNTVYVKCDFTVIDTGSGPATVRASFVSPEGDALLHMTAGIIKDVVSSNPSTGEMVLSASVPVYTGMPSGNWTMVTAMPLAPSAEDRNGNEFYYEGVDTSLIWTRPTFEVFSQPDTTPPVVQKFGCSATQVIVPFGGEDTYSCQLVVQDDLSGFAYGELVFENPDRNSTATLRFDANTRQVQFARGGIFAPTLSFDPTAPGGMWTVSKEGLLLRDLAGNFISYNPKELNDRSYPTFLLVSKTDAPPAKDSKSPASSLKASYSIILASLLGLFILQRR